MECLQNLPLDIAVEIDEQIAACHEVELGKGRVAQDVVRGKQDLFPERLADKVKTSRVGEELPQPRRRNIGQDGLEVPAGSRRFNGAFINVGGKYLNAGLAVLFC
jgi:hypothetical protein